METLTGTMNAGGGIIYAADSGTTLGNVKGTAVYKVLRDGSFSVIATGLQGASGNDFNSEGSLIQSNIAGSQRVCFNVGYLQAWSEETYRHTESERSDVLHLFRRSFS